MGQSTSTIARHRRNATEPVVDEPTLDVESEGVEPPPYTTNALGGLPDEVWTQLHSVCPPGRTNQGIDHVVIGPGGIFVVDTQDTGGTAKAEGARNNGRIREHAISETVESCAAVRTLLPQELQSLVNPVICFIQDEGVCRWVGDVMVCSTVTLPYLLMSRPPLMTAAQVRQATAILNAHMTPVVVEAPAPAQTAARKLAKRPERGPRTAPKRRKERTSSLQGVIARLMLAVTAIFLFLLFWPQITSVFGFLI